jgi:hypothetical protein
VIDLSLKLTVCGPDASRGSRTKLIRSFPGSVAILGFTGRLKFSTSFPGALLLNPAV